MPSILFCTPCYGGMVHAAHFQSCMNLTNALTETGLEHDWLIGTNESLITRARNEMTATFLESDHSHMMWLDADIEFSPDDVAKVWNLDADIGVGVYAMKKPGEDWYAAWKDGVLIKDLAQFDGPISVDYAGTGFMLIKRAVLERLASISRHYESKDGKRVPEIYKTPVHDGIFESEDYHFCRIAREDGYKVIMDPTVKLKHWGQWAYGS